MRGLVILAFDPGPEAAVEGLDVAEGVGVEVVEPALPEGPEPSPIFPFAAGWKGFAWMRAMCARSCWLAPGGPSRRSLGWDVQVVRSGGLKHDCYGFDVRCATVAEPEGRAATAPEDEALKDRPPVQIDAKGRLSVRVHDLRSERLADRVRQMAKLQTPRRLGT